MLLNQALNNPGQDSDLRARSVFKMCSTWVTSVNEKKLSWLRKHVYWNIPEDGESFVVFFLCSCSFHISNLFDTAVFCIVLLLVLLPSFVKHWHKSGWTCNLKHSTCISKSYVHVMYTAYSFSGLMLTNRDSNLHVYVDFQTSTLNNVIITFTVKNTYWMRFSWHPEKSR